jgi:hypothetical protein
MTLFEGDTQTLGKTLWNEDPNQFFEMLPSRTVAAVVTDIENIKGFDDIIKGLTGNTVSISVITCSVCSLQGAGLLRP